MKDDSEDADVAVRASALDGFLLAARWRPLAQARDARAYGIRAGPQQLFRSASRT